MKSEMELLEKIEAYLRSEMPLDEKEAFEQLRKENFELDNDVAGHAVLLKQLNLLADRRTLMTDMNAVHDTLDLEALKNDVLPATSVIKSLWKKYKISVSVAASVAIVSVLLTLLASGYFSATTSNYSALRRQFNREINNLKKSQNALIKDIKGSVPPRPANPGKFGGTGFALSKNGFIITNNHVINGADSVYIQNSDGEAYKVKVIYKNAAYDIAVLQITDPRFESLNSLPYTFKKTSSDLGERVFTMGFPKDNPVYGEGYLSSSTGYANDTLSYQVTIAVNPGNSGGPLLDPQGNVIGIISGKQTQFDGAAFAIKTEYLLKSIEEINQDSLENKLVLNKKSGLTGLSRKDQIKKLEDFIYMVKVY